MYLCWKPRDLTKPHIVLQKVGVLECFHMAPWIGTTLETVFSCVFLVHEFAEDYFEIRMNNDFRWVGNECVLRNAHQNLSQPMKIHPIKFNYWAAGQLFKLLGMYFLEKWFKKIKPGNTNRALIKVLELQLFKLISLQYKQLNFPYHFCQIDPKAIQRIFPRMTSFGP